MHNFGRAVLPLSQSYQISHFLTRRLQLSSNHCQRPHLLANLTRRRANFHTPPVYTMLQDAYGTLDDRQPSHSIMVKDESTPDLHADSCQRGSTKVCEQALYPL
jgi:hypothetical protein